MKFKIAIVSILVLILGCKKENPVGNCVQSNLAAPVGNEKMLPDELLVYHPSISTPENLASTLKAILPELTVLNKYNLMPVLRIAGGVNELELLSKALPELVVEPVQAISIFQSCSTAPVDLNEQVIPWGISRVRGGVTSPRRAWVVDTGIDLDHPDLNVNDSLSANFVGSAGLIGIPIGVFANDVNGHGTHVAGTIGAKNNSFGVIGMAPGCELVSVKVLDDDGRGNSGDLMNGLEYINENGDPGDVVNLSLGGANSFLLNQMVQTLGSRGFLIAIAAGNDREDASGTSPASANGANLYTVSAFYKGDNFASFSNFGNPPIDGSSPGVDILSTLPDGKYGYSSGTSMAAPHMAGVLLISQGEHNNGGQVDNDPDGNPDPILIVGATP
ncbi:S8 family serine peptidase [Luteibaculum oceani]|uniref:S8 family serine peptidase n=1 Tax=Luteibaculum oceani TaxID=1294296 RepID=A0A5C6V203_9FLAO|nr:S8 family serine peptidase [Luteibaculum oceani]TXC78830.1 S8 family serine peptidase [Luteibaculum oceani]